MRTERITLRLDSQTTDVDECIAEENADSCALEEISSRRYLLGFAIRPRGDVLDLIRGIQQARVESHTEAKPQSSPCCPLRGSQRSTVRFIYHLLELVLSEGLHPTVTIVVETPPVKKHQFEVLQHIRRGASEHTRPHYVRDLAKGCQDCKICTRTYEHKTR